LAFLAWSAIEISGPGKEIGPMGKIRRRFDANFKLEIVKQIISGEATQSQICREYQLSPNAIRRWMEKFEAGESLQSLPTMREKALEKEVKELKTMVGELVMPIEHLKNSTPM
jgi:transposase-like protein